MRVTSFLLAILLSGCAAAQSAEPQPSIATAAGDSVSPTKTMQTWWQPKPRTSWQIQFTGEQIDTSYDVAAYDLDLFDTAQIIVDELHSEGKYVICYLNAGAWENWRPDAAEFPEGVIGNDYAGWPGERWLDVSKIELLAPIIEARLDLCKEKGFDGVDPDNLDGYVNETGFELGEEDAIAYALWLAEEAHARGLAIGIKNIPELASRLEPHFDWALLESCFAQGWCEEMNVFIENGKPVFAIEYVEEGMTLEDFCAEAKALSFSAILKNRELDAWVEFC